MANDQCQAPGASEAEGYIVTGFAKPVEFVRAAEFGVRFDEMLTSVATKRVLSIGCAAATKDSGGDCADGFTLAIGDPGQRGKSGVFCSFTTSTLTATLF